MVDNVSNALSAYRAAVSRQVLPSSGTPVEPASPAGSFASMLKSAALQAERDNKQAEMLSIQAVKGTAVSNAEAALQTVVAVRDKVVSAYQEIMQMPI